MEKLKVAFIDESGKNEVKTLSHLPRVGDLVDLFYRPMPKVKEVVWFSNDVPEADVIILVG